MFAAAAEFPVLFIALFDDGSGMIQSVADLSKITRSIAQ
jgi:hypothetical protein